MMEDESNTPREEKGSELPPGIPIDWEAWLATQGPRLLLFARQQARREHEAEDILQDALVKLVRKVESGALPRIPECWAAYVYKVIHSLAINYGKRQTSGSSVKAKPTWSRSTSKTAPGCRAKATSTP